MVEIRKPKIEIENLYNVTKQYQQIKNIFDEIFDTTINNMHNKKFKKYSDINGRKNIVISVLNKYGQLRIMTHHIKELVNDSSFSSDEITEKLKDFFQS